jgi:hypothetical protein
MLMLLFEPGAAALVIFRHRRRLPGVVRAERRGKHTAPPAQQERQQEQAQQ